MATPNDRPLLEMSPDERVAAIGHRAYVGGSDAETWYGIGRLQYHFLVAQGLRHDHSFLDVACGSLRLGQYLIPYLDRGNYTGLDMVRAVIDAGLAHEVAPAVVAARAPQFLVNAEFDVTAAPPFHMAIAQSLFTHLTREDISRCAAALRPAAKPGARFFFTYFEGEDRNNPAGGSDPHECWFYAFDQIAESVGRTGWNVTRIGEWNHPRNQMMAVAEPL